MISATKHAKEAVVWICFDKSTVSCHQGMVLSDIPPQNWVKGGWAERKIMVVKEGFLTLLYLTLDVKNAT